MDAIVDFMQSRLFWRILLFCHFGMAVTLLTVVTLQAVTVLLPARQAAVGNFIERVRPIPATTVTALIVILYVPTFLLGAWVYIKYRTYVRIPMEQERYWWTVGAFEIKEHVVSMGMALLPAYWYFWRDPHSAEFARERKWLTLFLAVAVWYAFLVGHTANDYRGVGS
jgi:hypothetical protein